jgi:hypothetical protein
MHVTGTGGWQQYHVESVGTLHLATGWQMLTIKPTSLPNGWVMNLRQVTLTAAAPFGISHPARINN